MYIFLNICLLLQEAGLGKVSLSAFGAFGAFLEVCLILYPFQVCSNINAATENTMHLVHAQKSNFL